ncbi:MAG: type II secretion system F family protein [Actinomycetia bacterium]|nr:type II secretion system F family protein [Actinomycetes bacterium]
MDGQLGLLLGLLAIFIAIVILLTTIGTITSERQAVNRSLAAVRALDSAPSHMKAELDRPFGERVMAPSMDRLTSIGHRFTAGDQTDRIKLKLDLAGNPPNWTVDRVIAFKVLGLFAGLILGLLLGALIGGLLPTLACAVGLTLAGFYAPNMALHQLAYNRSDQIRKDLPDALDLLTISVEAGLAFDAAVSQVARNTNGPLADEFFRVLQEMQIGMGRSEAMRALGERTDVDELQGFVTAMIQADAFGIPIANVLRIQAREMRIKRSQRAEEQAQKVPVKILFPLIFCILPCLFIVVLGPAAINIYDAIIVGQ